MLAARESTEVCQPLRGTPVMHQLIHINVRALPGIVQQQQGRKGDPVALHAVGAGKLCEEGPEIWHLRRKTESVTMYIANINI